MWAEDDDTEVFTLQSGHSLSYSNARDNTHIYLALLCRRVVIQEVRQRTGGERLKKGVSIGTSQQSVQSHKPSRGAKLSFEAWQRE